MSILRDWRSRNVSLPENETHSRIFIPQARKIYIQLDRFAKAYNVFKKKPRNEAVVKTMKEVIANTESLLLQLRALYTGYKLTNEARRVNVNLANLRKENTSLRVRNNGAGPSRAPNANLARAIRMSLSPASSAGPNNNNNVKLAVFKSLHPNLSNNNALVQYAIEKSMKNKGKGKAPANNQNENYFGTSNLKNLNGYVSFSSFSGSSKGKGKLENTHTIKTSYNSAMQYIRTKMPNATWAKLIHMKNTTPHTIIAPHPEHKGSGFVVGTMKFYRKPPKNVVVSNEPAKGTWVDFLNNGKPVPAPKVNEPDSFNPAVKLKNIPWFVEVTKDGKTFRFQHSNAKINNAKFPQFWAYILNQYGYPANTAFNFLQHIKGVKLVSPNIPFYIPFYSGSGHVKPKNIRVIGKKKAYIELYKPLLNVGNPLTKNNLAQMIPKLTDNIPEYKLLKVLWKYRNTPGFDSTYILAFLRLIKLEPEITKHIKENPQLTNQEINTGLTQAIMKCHFAQTMATIRPENKVKYRGEFLQMMRGQLRTMATLFAAAKQKAPNKTQFEQQFIQSFIKKVGGRPCMENLLEELVTSIVEVGVEWKGKNLQPAMLVAREGNKFRISTNNGASQLKNQLFGLFMRNYYVSLNSRNKTAFNKSRFWEAVKNRPVHARNARGNVAHLKVSNIHNARTLANKAFDTYMPNIRN
jgi:hypothetical protein